MDILFCIILASLVTVIFYFYYKIKNIKNFINIIDEETRHCLYCQGNINEKLFFIIHELEKRIVELETKKCKCHKVESNKKEDKKDVKNNRTR